MGQMVQYMNQVWALLVRHHHILRLWTLYTIPSLHQDKSKKSALVVNL